MLPIHKIIWYEMTCSQPMARQNEPEETMDNAEQVESYVKAYAWGGPTSSLQLHHLRELSCMIRPGDTVLDLACGPGPLMLELAAIYPDSHFIGVDLSPTMLGHIVREAARLDLKNISVLCEDVREIPSLANRQVDLVITTSALHHLPDEDSLRQVFCRLKSLLNDGGGFYIFDFGQLKSRQARELFVAEVARLAPPLTVRDYDLSLQAAYRIDRVFELARQELPRPFSGHSSAIVDFFFFLQTPPRAEPTARARARIKECARSLSLAMKMEHLMLRLFRRSREFR